jgi:hypothetical protein
MMGEFDTITAMTDGKWWLSFEVAAPHQIASWTSFDPASSDSGNSNTTSVTQ